MARLLLISIVHEPDTVSTATIVTRLARELRNRGHDVAVLTSIPHYNPGAAVRGHPRYRASLLRPFRVDEEGGVRIVRCYVPQKPEVVARRLLDFAILHAEMGVGVLRYFRDRQVVIVISPPLTLALVGFIGRLLSQGRLIYNVQELWPDVPRDLGVVRNRRLLAVLDAVERWIYRSADKVVAIGPEFARVIVDRGGRPGDTVVIPNSVDTSVIVPERKDNPLSRAWGLAAAPVVLYAGNIGLTQDFDSVFHAARRLADEGVHFVIVGGGAARRGLEVRIRRERPRNVELRDFVPWDRVSQLYGMADVVLVPLREGHDRTTTPSKIFSAMAAGRPLVVSASHDTDLAMTIVRSKAGLVVPPGRPDCLADAIMRLLSNRRSEVWDSEVARTIAQRHSPEAITSSYERLLASLGLGPEEVETRSGDLNLIT